MKLPTFLICGAPKAGTTSLHKYLAEHPDICMSEPKETDYFQHNYEKGLDWFKSCFAHCKGEKVLGEASPGNMIHPKAAERIHKLNPDAKLVMILRNPVERAYSQFIYGITRGTTPPNISFSKFIRDEEDKWRNRVIQLGMYYEQILRFLDFFPKKQIKIYLYEDLKQRPEWLVKDLYSFLEVDPEFKPLLKKKYNPSSYPSTIYRFTYPIWRHLKRVFANNQNIVLEKFKGRMRAKMFGQIPEMSVEDKAYLSGIYYESIQDLEKMLNRDLSHWMK